MSEQATIGEPIDLATARAKQATWRITHSRFVDADGALDTIAARAAAILAASDLAKAIYGPLRLEMADILGMAV